jgi:hypothetical protein
MRHHAGGNLPALIAKKQIQKEARSYPKGHTLVNSYLLGVQYPRHKSQSGGGSYEQNVAHRGTGNYSMCLVFLVDSMTKTSPPSSVSKGPVEAATVSNISYGTRFFYWVPR